MVTHFNENAEKALIALAFDKPEILIELDVNAEAFYSLQHQTIWRTMLAMQASGKTPDVVTVAESLMEQIDIEKFLALNESARTWGVCGVWSQDSRFRMVSISTSIADFFTAFSHLRMRSLTAA